MTVYFIPRVTEDQNKVNKGFMFTPSILVCLIRVEFPEEVILGTPFHYTASIWWKWKDLAHSQKQSGQLPREPTSLPTGTHNYQKERLVKTFLVRQGFTSQLWFDQQRSTRLVTYFECTQDICYGKFGSSGVQTLPFENVVPTWSASILSAIPSYPMRISLLNVNVMFLQILHVNVSNE